MTKGEGGQAESKHSFIFKERLEMDRKMFLSQVAVAQRCTSIKSAVIHTSLWTLIPFLIIHRYVSKRVHPLHHILSM